jgi:hypothetical protein
VKTFLSLLEAPISSQGSGTGNLYNNKTAREGINFPDHLVTDVRFQSVKTVAQLQHFCLEKRLQLMLWCNVYNCVQYFEGSGLASIQVPVSRLTFFVQLRSVSSAKALTPSSERPKDYFQQYIPNA